MNGKSTEAGLADALRSEIDRDAEVLGPALFGGVPADGQRLSQPKYLDLVRRNWPNPSFRQTLRTQVGDEEFLRVAKAVTLPQPDQPPALMQAQMGAQAQQGGV